MGGGLHGYAVSSEEEGGEEEEGVWEGEMHGGLEDD